MDPNISVLFDGRAGISFVQGEDRSIQLAFTNKNDGTPLDLSNAKLSVNLPRASGGVVKRTNFPLTISASMVTPQVGVSYTDHGLCDGDSVNLVGSGLPAPLNSAGFYKARFIDNNTFGFYDSTGAAVALTSSGTGTFTVDASDITTANSGLATLAIDANVSAQVNPLTGQDFEVVVTSGGKTRVVVLRHALDVAAQPTP